MHGFLYKLRGISGWPECNATVSLVEVISDGGRSGLVNKIYFSYFPYDLQTENGKLTVDSYSSLYSLEVGDNFKLQYDPNNSRRIYCEEAKSLSLTIRKIIIFVGIAFAFTIFSIEFFGNNGKF